MTFRERLQKEHPDFVGAEFVGGCRGCPSGYGYEAERGCCNANDIRCAACWDREIINAGPSTSKSVYIAGPITGVPDYFGAFMEAAEILEHAGYIPLTPTWQPQGLTNAQYMRMCLSMIDNADAVLFLTGWDKSKGARLERDYCQYIEKPYSYTLAGIEEVLDK